MKTYTFDINNNTFSNSFHTTNWTEILDDLITTNVKKANPWLDIEKNLAKKNFFTTKDDKFFKKAADFLSKYNNKNKKFIIGKTYYFGNTPVIFYDDQIQIDYDVYTYDDFEDFSFLSSLNDSKKKTIIDIYIKGDADINIIL